MDSQILQRCCVKLYIEETPPKIGSGAFVSKDGYLLTAYHNIFDPKGNPRNISFVEKIGNEGQVVRYEKKTNPLQLVQSDKTHDVALVKVDLLGQYLSEWLSINPAYVPQEGDIIQIISYDAIDSDRPAYPLEKKIIRGSGVDFVIEGRGYPGMSGSPVLMDDKVVGIVKQIRKDGDQIIVTPLRHVQHITAIICVSKNSKKKVAINKESAIEQKKEGITNYSSINVSPQEESIIKIVDVSVQGRDQEFPGLFHVVFKLNKRPDDEWIELFHNPTSYILSVHKARVLGDDILWRASPDQIKEDRHWINLWVDDANQRFLPILKQRIGKEKEKQRRSELEKAEITKLESLLKPQEEEILELILVPLPNSKKWGVEIWVKNLAKKTVYDLSFRATISPPPFGLAKPDSGWFNPDIRNVNVKFIDIGLPPSLHPEEKRMIGKVRCIDSPPPKQIDFVFVDIEIYSKDELPIKKDFKLPVHSDEASVLKQEKEYNGNENKSFHIQKMADLAQSCIDNFLNRETADYALLKIGINPASIPSSPHTLTYYVNMIQYLSSRGQLEAWLTELTKEGLKFAQKWLEKLERVSK